MTFPTEKSTRTRERVVAAAVELFDIRGIDETSILEIAERADVSVGTIYRYFAGKMGIALHVVTVGLDALAADLADSEDLPSPLDRIEAAGDAYFRFATLHPVASRFAAVRALQPNGADEYALINAACETRVRRIVLHIAEDIRKAMERDEISRAPIDATMILLWAQWNGVVALMLRRDGLAIPPELAARSLELARADWRLAAEHRRATGQS